MRRKEIRDTMLEKRMAYTVSMRAPMDKVIHDAIIERVTEHQTIALYASFRNEVDTYGIMETLFWDETKTLVLPRVEGNVMHFYAIKSFSDLQMNAMGILEPIGDTVIDPNTIDVVLVPLLAFNQKGYRLGYGGGYYDRYLQHQTFLKIGLAYDFQYNEEFEVFEHDVACDAIITNSEVYA